MVRQRGHGTSALDYLVQAPDGGHLAGELSASVALRPGWSIIEVASAREDDGRPESVRALVTGLGGGLLLVVGDDLGRITEVQEAIATALGWTVGLAGLLGIGGGMLLSRGFLNRVDAIARTA